MADPSPSSPGLKERSSFRSILRWMSRSCRAAASAPWRKLSVSWLMENLPGDRQGQSPGRWMVPKAQAGPTSGDVLGAGRIAGREALLDALIDQRFLAIFGSRFLVGELVVLLAVLERL